MASSFLKLRIQIIHRHLWATGPLPKSRMVARNISLCETATSQRYRYTLDNNLMSSAERQSYEENGFLVIRNLIPDHFLDVFRQRFIDIADGTVATHGVIVVKDVSLRNKDLKGEHYVYKLHNIVFDNILFQYCCLPQVIEYVRCFTGPNVMAVNTMFINKPPDAGTLSSRHPLHQDLYFFAIRPVDKLVCAWTALEKTNRQNGCLVAIPGSHKGELLTHGYPDWKGGVNKGCRAITTFSDDLPRSYIEMEKGDTVFFHPLLIHGSGANRTAGYRKVMACHYAASECHYIDVTGTSQEDIAQEMLEMEARRGKKFNNMADYWRYRARLASGQKINL